MELLDRHFAALSRGGDPDPQVWSLSARCATTARGPRPPGENEIVVFEGIHALNDSIVYRHPEAAKLYISARSNINEGSVLRFKGTWMRLTRRAVRDYNFRGTGWRIPWICGPMCAAGEAVYLPFKNKADIIFDSSPHEVSVMKHYALPLLRLCRRRMSGGGAAGADRRIPVFPAHRPGAGG